MIISKSTFKHEAPASDMYLWSTRTLVLLCQTFTAALNCQDFAITGFDMRNIVGSMAEIDTNASSERPWNMLQQLLQQLLQKRLQQLQLLLQHMTEINRNDSSNKPCNTSQQLLQQQLQQLLLQQHMAEIDTNASWATATVTTTMTERNDKNDSNSHSSAWHLCSVLYSYTTV